MEKIDVEPINKTGIRHMNKSKLNKILKTTSVLWTKNSPLNNKEVSDIWCNTLKEYDLSVIKAAVIAQSQEYEYLCLMDIVGRCKIIKKLEENRIEEEL